MPFYGLHSTRKVEREKVMAKEPTLIKVSPADIHNHPRHKAIVWEEDTGKYYEHNIDEFMEVLKQIDQGIFDPYDNPYVDKWGYKGEEVKRRMERLPSLYASIKAQGILYPISVGMTGERFDGSFRSKIALHLGIKEVPAQLFKFHWKDIDEDWITRKIATHWHSTGKEYYEFNYNPHLKNIYEGGPVYLENAAPRWELIKPFIKGKVLDLGCNEGYLSIQAAIAGHETKGYDRDCIHGANLNKIIFEWNLKRDLPVEFEEKDILEVAPGNEDTVLILNVIYHLPRERQVAFLAQFKGKNVIIQCNLRKEHERDKYYGSHPDDMKDLIKKAGLKVVKKVAWRDKPLIIAT